MNEIVDLISTFGFPMVLCGLFYMDSRKDKERLYKALDNFGDKMDKFDQTLQGIDHRLTELEERSK